MRDNNTVNAEFPGGKGPLESWFFNALGEVLKNDPDRLARITELYGEAEVDRAFGLRLAEVYEEQCSEKLLDSLRIVIPAAIRDGQFRPDDVAHQFAHVYLDTLGETLSKYEVMRELVLDVLVDLAE